MFGLINYKVYVEQGTWAVGLDIIFFIYSQETFLFDHLNEGISV